MPAMARRRDPLPGAMLALAIAVGIVILMLLAATIWLSFRDGPPDSAAARYSVTNYTELFREPATYAVIANTVGFAAMTLVVAMVFGVPIAWLVERTDFRGKTLTFTMMTVGLLMPGFASAMGWLFLFHPRIGMVNVWLRNLFGIAPLDIASVAGMGWVQGINLAPVAFIMTAAVLRAMDPALEEAAQMGGAHRGAIFWRVTLRLAWPGILAAAIYIFTMGFAAFDVPAIIGWSNRVFTFSTYLLLQLRPENVAPRYGAAAALATVLIVIAVAMSGWYGRMQGRAQRYQIVTGKAYRPRLVPLGRGAAIAWILLAVYFLLSEILPLLVLVWASVLPYFQVPSLAALHAVSLDHYTDLSWDLVLEGALNTGILMLLTPTLTLVVAIAFSWIVLRSRVPGRQVFDFIAFLPHAVPSIIFGVSALLFALYVIGPYLQFFGSLWILLTVFVIARVSYATRMTNGGLIQIHQELEESAKVGGAGTAGILAYIVAPLMAPTLVYAWIWIALLTFRELTLAVVLTGRDNITLPVVIWSTWLSGNIGEASALAVVMLLVMVPAVSLFWAVARRKGLSLNP
jgi:iron(III) transport system permease protein